MDILGEFLWRVGTDDRYSSGGSVPLQRRPSGFQFWVFFNHSISQIFSSQDSAGVSANASAVGGAEGGRGGNNAFLRALNDIGNIDNGNWCLNYSENGVKK